MAPFLEIMVSLLAANVLALPHHSVKLESPSSITTCGDSASNDLNSKVSASCFHKSNNAPDKSKRASPGSNIDLKELLNSAESKPSGSKSASGQTSGAASQTTIKAEKGLIKSADLTPAEEVILKRLHEKTVALEQEHVETKPVWGPTISPWVRREAEATTPKAKASIKTAFADKYGLTQAETAAVTTFSSVHKANPALRTAAKKLPVYHGPAIGTTALPKDQVAKIIHHRPGLGGLLDIDDLIPQEASSKPLTEGLSASGPKAIGASPGITDKAVTSEQSTSTSDVYKLVIRSDYANYIQPLESSHGSGRMDEQIILIEEHFKYLGHDEERKNLYLRDVHENTKRQKSNQD